MDIKSVKCVYSGKAGSTKRIASAVGNVLSEDVSCAELCGKGAASLSFAAGDVLVAVLPVCGLRLPADAVSALRRLQGSGGAAIAVVLSGEGDYGDALLELCDTLGAVGFSVAGAAAFFTDGCTRPDDGDFSKLVEFATACSDRLADCVGCCRAPEVPGRRPYRKNAVGGKMVSFFKTIFGGGAKRPVERPEPAWFI